MKVQELAGTELGTRTVAHDERDAILFALTTGASAGELDLVYERDLQTLPTFGLTRALWVVEAAGDLGAYDRVQSVHAQQTLTVKKPLPARGAFEITGRITSVWDKGRAALVVVAADCDHFTAEYSIFLPGHGGWGGPRGTASAPAPEPASQAVTTEVATAPNQALLYRLTGDRHPIHVDPQVAADAGFGRPILHGLCTLSLAAHEAARACGRRPTDLRAVAARLAAPVYPGDVLRVRTAAGPDARASFGAEVDGTTVLGAGSIALDP